MICTYVRIIYMSDCEYELCSDTSRFGFQSTEHGGPENIYDDDDDDDDDDSSDRF